MVFESCRFLAPLRVAVIGAERKLVAASVASGSAPFGTFPTQT